MEILAIVLAIVVSVLIWLTFVHETLVRPTLGMSYPRYIADVRREASERGVDVSTVKKERSYERFVSNE